MGSSPAADRPGAAADGPRHASLRDKYAWNHHLMGGLLQQVNELAWFTPLVHGFLRQSSLSLTLDRFLSLRSPVVGSGHC